MKIIPLRINFRALAKMILCKRGPSGKGLGVTEGEILKIIPLRINFRALAKMILNRGCNGKGLGVVEREILKIRPLRINFRTLAKMILCKTDAPVARVLVSPKANFLKN